MEFRSLHFIVEKGEQEIETKMVLKLTGGNLEKKYDRKHLKIRNSKLIFKIQKGCLFLSMKMEENTLFPIK